MCIPTQSTCNCLSKVFNTFNVFKVSSLWGIWSMDFLDPFFVSCIILHLTGWNFIFLPKYRLGMCEFVFSMIRKTVYWAYWNWWSEIQSDNLWEQGAQHKRPDIVTRLDCNVTVSAIYLFIIQNPLTSIILLCTLLYGMIRIQLILHYVILTVTESELFTGYMILHVKMTITH